MHFGIFRKKFVSIYKCVTLVYFWSQYELGTGPDSSIMYRLAKSWDVKREL